MACRCLMLGVAALFLASCAPNPPFAKPYPTAGTVSYRNGEKLKGGSIQFLSANDPNLRITGAIDSEGQFRMFTTKDNWKEPGAPVGDYKVIVQPPAIDDLRGGAPPGHKAVPAVSLEDSVRVDAKDNVLQIVLPGP